MAIQTEALSVVGECLASEFFVGGQDCLRGIQRIFRRLVASATLTHRTRYFEHAGDDPDFLVGWLAGDGAFR